MICLILRSQHLCFAVARIFARCVRARTARESSRRRLDTLSSSLSCRKGRHMALGMGFSRGTSFLGSASYISNGLEPVESV